MFEAPQVLIPARARPRAALSRRSLAAAAHSVLALRRGGRGGLPALFEGAPFTTAFLLALAVTTATMASSRARAAHVMTFIASTNLHNLMANPLDVLFTSAFWVSSAWMFLPMTAALVLVVGAAERRLGLIPTVLVFVAGHVGATLVTVAGIAVGVAQGWLPSSLTYAIDVGPSYGVVAVGAVLVARTSNARLRHVAAALLVTALLLVVVVDQTFTDVGHVVAALLGLLVSRVTGWLVRWTAASSNATVLVTRSTSWGPVGPVVRADVLAWEQEGRSPVSAWKGARSRRSGDSIKAEEPQ